MQKSYMLILICLTLFFHAAVMAAVKLPAVFSDGMVLQQKEKAAFWGWAEPGEKIFINAGWSKQPVSTIADNEGKWKLIIATPSYGGPFEIRISGSNTITLKDVLIGEVWLCSGQSNMAFTVKGAENAKAEIASADFPAIRYFSVNRQYGPNEFDDAPGSVWQKASPATVPGFSAVAYFFAKKIYQETGIPVGILFNAWGGTPAEAWTPSAVLSGDAVLARYNQRWTDILNKAGADSAKYMESLKAWNKTKGTSDSNLYKKPAEPQTLYYYKRPWRAPAVLYNGMICPLAPYTIKGVLWYQGESNVMYADEYYHLFSSMIQSWRDKWQQPLPFYFVQIAPNGYKDLDGAARLREAQYLVSKKIPGAAMVATADIGNMKNIHPVKKKEVGDRLAFIALAKNYGKKNVIYKGPEVKKTRVSNGIIHLEFNQAIKLNDGEHPTGFEIGYKKPGTDTLLFVKAETKLLNNQVLVWSSDTKHPLAVRYAWILAADGNIKNEAGLPAYPFRVSAN